MVETERSNLITEDMDQIITLQHCNQVISSKRYTFIEAEIVNNTTETEWYPPKNTCKTEECTKYMRIFLSMITNNGHQHIIYKRVRVPITIGKHVKYSK